MRNTTAAGRGRRGPRGRDARRSVEVLHLFWPAMELASTGIISSGDASILSRVGRNRPQSGKPAQQGKGHVFANPPRPGATWAHGRLRLRYSRPGPGPSWPQPAHAGSRQAHPPRGSFFVLLLHLCSRAAAGMRRAVPHAPLPGPPAAQRPTCSPSGAALGARAPPGRSATSPRPPLQLLECAAGAGWARLLALPHRHSTGRIAAHVSVTGLL